MFLRRAPRRALRYTLTVGDGTSLALGWAVDGTIHSSLAARRLELARQLDVRVVRGTASRARLDLGVGAIDADEHLVLTATAGPPRVTEHLAPRDDGAYCRGDRYVTACALRARRRGA